MRAMRSAMSGCMALGQARQHLRGERRVAGWRGPARSSAATRCAGTWRSARAATRRRNSKGRVSALPESRPRSCCGALAARARARSPRARTRCRRRRRPAAWAGRRGQLAEDRLGRLRSDGAQARHLPRQALDLLLARRCSTSAARSEPSAAISTAALRAPAGARRSPQLGCPRRSSLVGVPAAARWPSR